ncbi:MAG: FAD/NAD(P)-binding oxidoreductase [Gammaproteobacteria bacterium]|nr:FAD/NAD(P)-binding oxidoreductase [Gammaproteobacteria bacterium]
MQHVIIGAGPAGVIAAETLRKQDPAASITLIGDEPEPPYSRMAIPYYLIGNIEEAGTYLREPDQHLRGLNIDLLHTTVTGVDPASKTLSLSSGDPVSYDKLLIATGSQPVSPPIAGMDHERVSSCWTLEDARKIIANTEAGSEVVLIGAGFIGSIILEALVQRGVNLSVVETGDRMVPRMLDDKAGNLLKRWCESKGVRVFTSCSVQAISDAGDGVRVSLSNGDSLAAQLVISATGVKPNIDFLAGSGIKTDQGVLVNEWLQTSDPNVYAAGDVAQGLDFSTGEHSVQAIQPTATDHGRIAALNMAGIRHQHHGSVNMNVLDTLGLISHSFGLWMGVNGGDSSTLYTPDDYKYLNLQFDGEHLVGASCTGMTQHIGILRGLIETRLPLGDWKPRLLQDPTAFVEAYMARTQEIGYHA